MVCVLCEVEKALIFNDFCEYQEQLSLCLTISLGVLSVLVIIYFVRVITVRTVTIIFQKQLEKSYPFFFKIKNFKKKRVIQLLRFFILAYLLN